MKLLRCLANAFGFAMSSKSKTYRDDMERGDAQLSLSLDRLIHANENRSRAAEALEEAALLARKDRQ